jgi:PAS domain S-box-containing protein
VGGTDDLTRDVDRQRRYYETLIEVSPTAIVTCDPNLVVRSWNPAAERLFGYSRQEAVGRNVDELVANNDEVRDESANLSRAVLEGPLERVSRRTARDGTLVDVVIKAAPITIEGEVVGVYALYEDVRELVRQRRFFESLLEISPVAVIMVDDQMRVTTWNPAAERLFGYTATEAIGVNIDELVARHPNVHDEAVTYSAQAWGLPSFRRLARRTRKDGTLIDV